MAKVCECCELPLSAERLLAVPDATMCAQCLKVAGDVHRTVGCMVWDHKTAPELVIGKAAEALLPYQRRGFHAQLPMSARENPRMLAHLGNVNLSLAVRFERPQEEVDLESASFSAARCHPDRPRINPAGDCVECATSWYQQRLSK